MPSRTVAPKLLPDGRAMLNIGCGWKMHPAWNNLDFSPYARLAQRPALVQLLAALGILTPLRQQRLAQVDPKILCHDLRRGIPFADASLDVVYHSHFLEHLDRSVAPLVLQECKRVLRPGGILRVVVPDWAYLTRQYLAAAQAAAQRQPNARALHDQAMHDLIDQMVRTHATGAAKSGWAGRLERWTRGGAAETGELHRWMYDEYNLRWLVTDVGFRDPKVERATTSRISGWANFGLDVNEDGSDYKPESLYLEALK